MVNTVQVKIWTTRRKGPWKHSKPIQSVHSPCSCLAPNATEQFWVMGGRCSRGHTPPATRLCSGKPQTLLKGIGKVELSLLKCLELGVLWIWDLFLFWSLEICKYVMTYLGYGLNSKPKIYASYTPYMHGLKVTLYNILNNFVNDMKFYCVKFSTCG